MFHSEKIWIQGFFLFQVKFDQNKWHLVRKIVYTLKLNKVIKLKMHFPCIKTNL